MSGKRGWTDQDLTTAVSNNETLTGVLRSLNLSVGGYNGSYVKKHIKRLALDMSHFKGHRVKKTRNSTTFSSNVTREQLVSGTAGYTNNTSLKNRLIKEGLLEEKCSSCALGPFWNSNPLSLQMDHIDGNSKNNILTNLRILCPNCHTQTPTFCGRKKKGKFKLNRLCKSCESPVYSHRVYCDKCVLTYKEV